MVILLILLSLVVAATAVCPVDYTYYPETQKCYKLFINSSTFFAADDVCRQYGGTLASIHNKVENEKLYDMTRYSKGDHWIGLTSMINGHNFTWLDKSPQDYEYWDPAHPNIQLDCVLMDYGLGRWRTHPCDKSHRFICQYDPDHRIAPDYCPAPPTCPACSHSASPSPNL